MDPIKADRPKARRIEGDSTSETTWLAWEKLQNLPKIEARQLVPQDARLVIVAPHPDDEILMAAGLLQQLHAAGRPYLIIAVTDGEGSHPNSNIWNKEKLHAARPLESAAAAGRLGIGRPEFLRLGLPDGQIGQHVTTLHAWLRQALAPTDIVVTTWSGDGHPDHDVCGAQVSIAATDSGARLLEVPVWMWHWSCPGDARLPWHRARALRLSADESARKRDAVNAFSSQLAADPSTGRDAVLSESVLARAGWPLEVYFV